MSEPKVGIIPAPLLNISVEQSSVGWWAIGNADPSLKQYGATIASAIGNLVRKYSENFGIVIETKLKGRP